MKPIGKGTAAVLAAGLAFVAVTHDNDDQAVDNGVRSVVEPVGAILGGAGDLATVTVSEGGRIAAVAGGAAQGAGNGAQNQTQTPGTVQVLPARGDAG